MDEFLVASLPYVVMRHDEWKYIIQYIQWRNLFPSGYTFLSDFDLTIENGKLCISLPEGQDLIQFLQERLDREINELQTLISHISSFETYAESIEHVSVYTKSIEQLKIIKGFITEIETRRKDEKEEIKKLKNKLAVIGRQQRGGRKKRLQQGGTRALQLLKEGLKKILFLKPSSILPLPPTPSPHADEANVPQVLHDPVESFEQHNQQQLAMVITIPHIRLENAQDKKHVYIINPPFEFDTENNRFILTIVDGLQTHHMSIGFEELHNRLAFKLKGTLPYFNFYVSSFQGDIRSLNRECFTIPIIQIPDVTSERGGCLTVLWETSRDGTEQFILYKTDKSIFKALQGKSIENLYIFEYWYQSNSLLYYELETSSEEGDITLDAYVTSSGVQLSLSTKPELLDVQPNQFQPLKRFLSNNLEIINQRIHGPLKLTGGANGGKGKIRILGRYRNIHVRGRTKYITYKKELMKLSDAKKLDKALNKAKQIK